MNYKDRVQQVALLEIHSNPSVHVPKLAHQIVRTYRDEYLEYMAVKGEPLTIRLIEEYYRGFPKVDSEQLEFPLAVLGELKKAPVAPVYGVPNGEGGVYYKLSHRITPREWALVREARRKTIHEFSEDLRQIEDHMDHLASLGIPEDGNLEEWEKLHQQTPARRDQQSQPEGVKPDQDGPRLN